MSGKRETFAADEWRRHGSIMPACLAGVMLVGVHGYTLGVMIRPLEQEFGWSRAEISTGPLIPSITAILLAPLIGVAVDRFGPRRIALFGIPFFSLTLALLSTATSHIFTWWALYSLLGLASMFILPTVWTAAINARFDRNRGLALAIALAGTGLASAIMPVTATALVQSFGWRGAYVAIGAMCFLVAFPLVYFLFDRDGARRTAPAAAVSTSQHGAPSRRAELTSRRFLKLAGAALVFSMAACVLTVNAVPILLGEGFDPLAAAQIAGLVGIGTIAGRLGGGFLLDLFDARFVAAASGIAPLIGAALLLATHDAPAAAVAACLAFGVAGGAEYDACAYLTARHFGMRNFGALFGMVGGLVLFGAGLAPVLANYVYDLTGSYDSVLWGLLPGFALATFLFLLLGPYPRDVDVTFAGPN